ncbi:hypothetical protein M2164_000218 [Streptomyces sp. SAI-208]|uniref:hypothetical protein n=1 Tax=Streptomyces sp. SAI-208 TaxID=2940550 RepID=UPI0024730C25|nr:hypothetical protein [Streptomyces sp. SAI-208]MDH6604583.1 hypothetical protein [Streptomyces sp. SAI-208]
MATAARAYVLIAACTGVRSSPHGITSILAGVLATAAPCTTAALTADSLPATQQTWLITASIA